MDEAPSVTGVTEKKSSSALAITTTTIKTTTRNIQRAHEIRKEKPTFPRDRERIVYPRNIRPLVKTPVIGGTPIQETTCMALRTLVFGSCANSPKGEWARTGLTLRAPDENLSFGLRVPRNSTRGLVTVIQAVILKHVLFKSNKEENRSIPENLLKVNHERQVEVLSAAISEIIWQCAGGGITQNKASCWSPVTPPPARLITSSNSVDAPKAIVVLPQEAGGVSYVQNTSQYFQDGLTETLHLFEFTSLEDLEIFIKRYLYLFQDEGGPGAILLLYSILLSRGLSNVRNDMEDSKCSILGGGGGSGGGGGCPEEGPLTIVMLALTGRASPHLHNGVIHIGDEDTCAIAQWGVLVRSEVGFLVHDAADEMAAAAAVAATTTTAATAATKINKIPGSRLKTPSLPIWLTLCSGHYGVLFNTNRELLRNYHAERRFEVQYYTCGGSHALLTIDTRPRETIPRPDVYSSSREPLAPAIDIAITPLEKLIHSKWKDAQIQWNGTPVL